MYVVAEPRYFNLVSQEPLNSAFYPNKSITHDTSFSHLNPTTITSEQIKVAFGEPFLCVCVCLDHKKMKEIIRKFWVFLVFFFFRFKIISSDFLFYLKEAFFNLLKCWGGTFNIFFISHISSLFSMQAFFINKLGVWTKISIGIKLIVIRKCKNQNSIVSWKNIKASQKKKGKLQVIKTKKYS